MSDHQIVSITGALTRNNTPMWRCATRDGLTFAIFPDRNDPAGAPRFFDAYASDILAIENGAVQRWTAHPITVQLVLDGAYHKVVAVAPRPASAAPDVPFVPDHERVKHAAQTWAREVLRWHLVIWDCETTGTDALNDEMVSIGAIDAATGAVLLDQTIRPVNPQRLVESGAGAVNGLAPETLITAPTFVDVYADLERVLDHCIWGIYNQAFDSAVLSRECLRHNRYPIMPLATVCAMDMFARFYGDWDAERQSYRNVKLADAAAYFDIETVNAHNALADALMTRAVIQGMAGYSPAGGSGR